MASVKCIAGAQLLQLPLDSLAFSLQLFFALCAYFARSGRAINRRRSFNIFWFERKLDILESHLEFPDFRLPSRCSRSCDDRCSARQTLKINIRRCDSYLVELIGQFINLIGKGLNRFLHRLRIRRWRGTLSRRSVT